MPALNDWGSKTDEQVFGGVHEQDGSQYAYWRDIEIKRRLYLLQKQSLDAQIAATEAQRQATAAQEKAVDVMHRQSRIMLWSVIGVFLTALVTLVAAFANYSSTPSP